jgi:hypothetical protein
VLRRQRPNPPYSRNYTDRNTVFSRGCRSGNSVNIVFANRMPVNNSLLIDIEALRARLKIRDFFLENTVREIYQNVGQVLSAVRIELDAARPDPGIMHSAGQLVGQSIRDLRLMSKHFNPDTALLEHGGFTETIKRVTEILYPENAPVISCKERQNGIQPEVKWIAFSAFLKMLIRIKEKEKWCSGVVVSSTQTALNMALSFESKSEDEKQENRAEEMAGLNQSIALLQGECQFINKRNGMTIWKLNIPLK